MIQNIGSNHHNIPVDMDDINKQIASMKLVIDQLVIKQQKSMGTVLPTASVDNRGKTFLLKGASGVADKTYICLKGTSNTYSWVLK